MESSETIVIAIPVISVRGEYYVSHHFGRAPYYAIVEMGRSGYKRIEILENPSPNHVHGHGRGGGSHIVKLLELFTPRRVSSVVVLGIGPGAYYRLREQGIKIYYLPFKPGELIPLSRAIEAYLNNQVEEAVEPRELD